MENYTDRVDEHIDDHTINTLIDQRAHYRRTRDFSKADEIKLRLEKSGVHLADIPYKLGGGSSWCRIIPPPEKVGIYDLSKEAYLINNHTQDRVQEIVHISKKYLSAFSVWRQQADTFTHDHEMTGRKYADIAFNFAMAGVDDIDLFELLMEGHMSEISRFGHRKSCGVMDLVQMTEKLACAGILDQKMYQLVAQIIRGKEDFTVCSSLASLESGRYSVLSDHPLRILWRFAAKQSKYGRQCSVPPLQKEQPVSLEPGSDNESDILDDDDAQECGVGCPGSDDGGSDFLSLSLADIFQDCSLPLVLDLGCGYGVSQLGLCVGGLILDGSDFPPRFLQDDVFLGCAAKRQRRNSCPAPADDNRQGVNFLGCDMSTRAVAYANGVSRRWGLGSRCVFVRGDVVEFVQWVERELRKGVYTGRVAWISINFPTPYSQQLMPDVIEMYLRKSGGSGQARLESGGALMGGMVGGNSQLPVQLSHFMITPSLIRLCGELFDAHGMAITGGIKLSGTTILGGLYLQSNAEDVAVISQYIVKDAESSQAVACRFVATGNGQEDALSVAEMCGVWECVQTYPCKQHIGQLGVQAQGCNADSTTTERLSLPSKRQSVWKDALASAGLIPQKSADSDEAVMKASPGYHREGLGWDDIRPFDTTFGLTETEAIYKHNKKPVYRQVYARIGQ